jgi:hypothetical protein
MSNSNKYGVVLNEPILPDEYLLCQGHLYVVNGKVREFIDGENVTVGRYKTMSIPGVPQATEVRRCDVVGRQVIRAYEHQEEVQAKMVAQWGRDLNGPPLENKKNKHKKPKRSYRIKKSGF